jgi:hypothetical protein
MHNIQGLSETYDLQEKLEKKKQKQKHNLNYDANTTITIAS